MAANGTDSIESPPLGDTMTNHERFFRNAIDRIASEKPSIVDIGGSLRIDRDRGNRYDPAQAAWIRPYLDGRTYRILDKVRTYRPHIVGDVQHLPFGNGEIPAVICLSVLAHVEDPGLAMRELHRCLAPGGYLLLYLPFLFPYCAVNGYYRDYWRFSADSVRLLTRSFHAVDIVEVGSRASALVLISPLARYNIVRRLAARLDPIVCPRSPHTAGHYALCIK